MRRGHALLGFWPVLFRCGLTHRGGEGPHGVCVHPVFSAGGTLEALLLELSLGLGHRKQLRAHLYPSVSSALVL